MALGRTQRALYDAALNSADATAAALDALTHLARDFNQGDPDGLMVIAERARKLSSDIEDELSYAL